MTTQQIGYFIRLAEELNYARAAREFFITQPTLSRQIINLENELQLNLFIRDRNSVSLTREGQFFYEKIKPVFQNMLDIINEARNMEPDAEQITIGIQDDQLISDILMLAISRLRYENPDVNVAIHKADPDELAAKLGTQEYDLVNIALIPTIQQNLPYTFLQLEAEPVYLVYSAKSTELGESITKEELYDYLEHNKLIMPVLHKSANDDQARKYFTVNTPALDPDRVIHHLSQSGRAISLPVQVASGLGVTLSNHSNVYSIDPQLRIARVEGTEGTYRKGIAVNCTGSAACKLIEIIKILQADALHTCSAPKIQ